MNLGDILVAKRLVSSEDIKRALEHQRQNGGRLGPSLVALGMLTEQQINKVLEDAPQAPLSVPATGIDPALLRPPVNVLRVGLGFASQFVNPREVARYFCDRVERQLAANGFEMAECLDVEGASVGPGEDAVGSHELHYAALRTERRQADR